MKIPPKNKKILLFGPMTPPYNGQAVAFTTIKESYHSKNSILINTAKFNYSLVNTLNTIIQTLYVFLTSSFSTIYFTGSRSKLGFIKELPLLLLGKWTNKRIVNHLHGAEFQVFYENSGFLKPVVKYAYEGVHSTIVLLDEMKNQFTEFPKMELTTVANCYRGEFDNFQYDRAKKKQLLYFSNLMKSKGIFEFLEASKTLLENHPNLIVKIAGSPLADYEMNLETVYSSFQDIFKKLKNRFPDRIEYLGVVTGELKLKLFFESSIFVLPSYYPTEAFPITIIEAMRAGNAIITTNHNYLSSIIKPENGKIIEPKSADDIVFAVSSLLNDELQLEKIQQHNTKEAKKKYSQSRYINEVRSIIDSN